MNEQSLSFGVHRLQVAIGPQHGPPLILLHGITRKWTDFAPLLAHLLPRWQVIGLNFRGHGGSTRTPGHYLLRDYLTDAVRALEPLCKEPAVLLGHSLGALAAIGLAGQRPELVRAIAVEDPPSVRLMPRIRETPFFMLFDGLQRLAGSARPIPELVRLVGQLEMPQGPGKPSLRLGELRDATSLRYTARCLQELDPEALTPLLAGQLLDGVDWQQTLGKVRCPALVLYGEMPRGGMLSQPEAEEMGRTLPDAAVLQVKGVGHLLHWLGTEETVRYMLGFLESLR